MPRLPSLFTRRLSVRVIGFTAVALLATGLASNLLSLTIDRFLLANPELISSDFVSPALLSQNDLGVQVRRQILLSLFVMVLLVPLMSVVLRTSVFAPLKRLERQVTALAHGDLECEVTADSDDEIGRLAATIEGMRVSLRESFDDLFRQNQRLSQLDQIKDEMVGQASHELRTPLTSIHGFVQVLAGGKAGPLTDLQDELLGMVGRNVDRLRTLVCDLLDVERVDKTPLISAPVAAADLLQEVLDDQRRRAEDKGIGLILSVPAHTRVMGDKERLREVFNNLISNAIKYTEQGRVTVRSLHTHDRIVIEVQDTGIGIPHHLQPHVFDRFYRVEDDRVQDQEGSGLGLTIVKRLLTRQNGMISLSSEPGRGTTFRVTLPRAADELSPGGELGARPTVLVATPDPLDQTIYGATFTHDRYDVSYASSSSGVLLRTRREKPDLVVLALHDENVERLIWRVARGPGMAAAHFVVVDDPTPFGHSVDHLKEDDPARRASLEATRLPASASPQEVLAAVEERLGIESPFELELTREGVRGVA